jgi:RNA polymerase sigma-54 factor
VVPDILVTGSGASGWDIALNEATLPRLVVNRSYYVELREGCIDKASKSWLGEKLADAKALIKALDQRQRTILKVAAEIVKQQEGFFRQGVSQLKPLTLRAVAEAVSLHESTVSRVTSNKYLNCKRGTFELKYFFTSGVASADGEGAVSAEAVKAQIRALCDAEVAGDILSDDQLVDLLREKASTWRGARSPNTARRSGSAPRSSADGRRSWRTSPEAQANPLLPKRLSTNATSLKE